MKDILLKKILYTKIESYPWEHFIIKNFLPDNFYQNLIEELLNTIDPVFLQQKINSNNHRGPATTRTSLINNKQVHIYNLFKTMNSTDIKNSIINKFDICIHKLKDNKYCVGDINEYYYDISTFGHKYKVHRDSQRKLVTIVLHLATKGDDITLGTRMYPPVKHVKSLDWETDCVKITPYEPNTLVVFPPDKSKNKRSNHAMGHTSQKTKYRKNILTFFPLINNSI